jgi:predicted unusual protein kinase regulating ubiquinone biosynthesis (AarF/ABC1/UbiB family)
MAPNLKHITLLSESLINLEVIQPKEAVNQHRQAQQASKQTKTVVSENYWEWTSEPVLTTDFF